MANFAPHLTLPSAHDIEKALAAQLVECLAPLLLPLEQSGTSGSSTLALMNTVAKTTGSGGNGTCFFASSSPESLLENVLHLPTLPVQFIHTTSWDTVTDVYPVHKSESQRSFNALMSIHSILYNWHQEAVLHLFSSTNPLGNIVLAHLCCIRFILSPLSVPEPAMKMPIKAAVEWIEKVVDAVEDDDEVQWTQYVEWPQKILTTMRCCINQKRGLTFGDLYNIYINDPGAYREGRMRKL